MTAPFGSPSNTPPPTQTTLLAAIPADQSDPFASSVDIIPLASLAGISAIMLNQLSVTDAQKQYFLQIDFELMAIVTLNGGGDSVRVIRGVNGTGAVPHAIGATVLYGLGTQFNQN
jgi:hypothetical protein